MNTVFNTASNFYKKWEILIFINIAVIVAISAIFYSHFNSLWQQTRPAVFVDIDEAFTPQISTQRVIRSAHAAIAGTVFGSNSMPLEPLLFNEPFFSVPILGDDDEELKATVYVSAVTGEVLSITFREPSRRLQ